MFSSSCRFGSCADWSYCRWWRIISQCFSSEDFNPSLCPSLLLLSGLSHPGRPEADPLHRCYTQVKNKNKKSTPNKLEFKHSEWWSLIQWWWCLFQVHLSVLQQSSSHYDKPSGAAAGEHGGVSASVLLCLWLCCSPTRSTGYLSKVGAHAYKLYYLLFVYLWRYIPSVQWADLNFRIYIATTVTQLLYCRRLKSFFILSSRGRNRTVFRHRIASERSAKVPAVFDWCMNFCILQSSSGGGGLAQRCQQQRPADRTGLHPAVSPPDVREKQIQDLNGSAGLETDSPGEDPCSKTTIVRDIHI